MPDNSPATKDDLKQMKDEIFRHLDLSKEETLRYVDLSKEETLRYVDLSKEETLRYVDLSKEETLRYIDLSKEETFRHFDLSVETIRHDLLGANHDEIEVLKDARKDHGQRIQVLEQHAGVSK